MNRKTLNNFGVYQIRNVKNGKLYIGSTSSDGFRKRWQKHKNALRSNYHDNAKLQNAWNKHGSDAFVFEVLLCCDPERCLINEQVLLNELEPAYNIAKIAGAPMKGLKHSKETKARFSVTRKGNKHLLGHRHTEETKKKMSLTKIGANHPKAKLTELQVVEIKSLLRQDINHVDIAHMYQVSKSTITAISTGQNWSHVV